MEACLHNERTLRLVAQPWTQSQLTLPRESTNVLIHEVVAGLLLFESIILNDSAMSDRR